MPITFRQEETNMKKLLLIALALAMLLVLASCACEHEWADADCVTPKTCTKCQEIEGVPAGHTWSAATCVDPKICEDCAATEGEPKGHEWTEATCTEPNICSVCGETDGEPLGHAWVDATEFAPKTCSACGVTEGDPLPMVRQDLGMDYETFVSQMSVPLYSLGYVMEYYGVNTDGMPIYYINSLDGTQLAIEVGFELLDDLKTVYSVTVATGNASDVALANSVGNVASVAMAIADPSITQEVISSLGTVTPVESEGLLVYSIEHNGMYIMMMIGTGLVGFYICPAA